MWNWTWPIWWSPIRPVACSSLRGTRGAGCGRSATPTASGSGSTIINYKRTSLLRCVSQPTRNITAITREWPGILTAASFLGSGTFLRSDYGRFQPHFGSSQIKKHPSSTRHTKPQSAEEGNWKVSHSYEKYHCASGWNLPTCHLTENIWNLGMKSCDQRSFNPCTF